MANQHSPFTVHHFIHSSEVGIDRSAEQRLNRIKFDLFGKSSRCLSQDLKYCTISIEHHKLCASTIYLIETPKLFLSLLLSRLNLQYRCRHTESG